MTKILVNSQGKALLTGNGKPLTKVSGGGGHTGTVDTVGLTALGWDSYDIQWLQDHVWWDAEDDAEWAVTEANKAFGPNGATPLTWNTRSSIQYNPDCRYLPKLTLPNNTNSMYSVFTRYVHLVAIPTHGWDLSAVTRYDHAFRMCYNLRSIGDTSYFVTANTTQVEMMFDSSPEFFAIDVSHWNTSNVTTFQNTFAGTAIESIDMSDFSLAKVTTMSSMFNTCRYLTSVKFPTNASAPLLTVMPSFASCPSLKELTLSLTAATLTNSQGIIYYCSGIKRFKLSLASTSVTSFTQLAAGCGQLLELDLTDIDTTSCAQAGLGNSVGQSPFSATFGLTTIKLGANFFKGSFTTLYVTESNSWTRDSIYESLYTNQTTRDSNSNAVTVKLSTQAYDRLSAQDISDIATKNITLTRG